MLCRSGVACREGCEAGRGFLRSLLDEESSLEGLIGILGIVVNG